MCPLRVSSMHVVQKVERSSITPRNSSNAKLHKNRLPIIIILLLRCQKTQALHSNLHSSQALARIKENGTNQRLNGRRHSFQRNMQSPIKTSIVRVDKSLETHLSPTFVEIPIAADGGGEPMTLS